MTEKMINKIKTNLINEGKKRERERERERESKRVAQKNKGQIISVKYRFWSKSTLNVQGTQKWKNNQQKYK